MYKRFFFSVLTFSTIFCFAAHPEYDRLRQDYLELQERYQAQQACYRQKLEAIDLMVHQQLKPLLKEAEQKKVEADEAIEWLQAELDQAEQAKQKAEKANRTQLEEALIVRTQLEELHSLEGWLFHKKGAGVWLGLALFGAAYKKGMFDWVPRYEQKIKKVLRAKRDRIRRFLLVNLSSKKLSRLQFTK